MRKPHTASSGKRNRTRILKKGPGRRISRRARLESLALPAAAGAAKSAGAGRPRTQTPAKTEVVASRVETSTVVEVTAANGVTESGAAEFTPRGAEPAPIGDPVSLTPTRGLPSAVALRAPAARVGDPGSSTPARATTACAGGPGSRVCCGFGAVRVGPLLGRLRLHLHTERFLAVHRHDAMWEEGCTEAALALAEIVEGMTGAEFDALLTSRQAQPATNAATESGAAELTPRGSERAPIGDAVSLTPTRGLPLVVALRAPAARVGNPISSAAPYAPERGAR